MEKPVIRFSAEDWCGLIRECYEKEGIDRVECMEKVLRMLEKAVINSKVRYAMCLESCVRKYGMKELEGKCREVCRNAI